jgi:hypothetical protein
LLTLPIRTLYRCTIRPLEPITSPQCPVVEVAGWLTLLYEFSRVKHSVVGLKPEVTGCLPAHLSAWTISDKTRVTLPSGNNQKSGDGIHSVAPALAPLKYPIKRRGRWG